MAIATLPVEQIESTVNSTGSHASGAFRQVWFVEDVVIKRDRDMDRGYGNVSEFEAYQKFEPADLEFHGITYSFRVPEMAMVGDYLIAQKIDLESTPHGYLCEEHHECYAAYFENGGDHSPICKWYRIGKVARQGAMHFGISDMHAGNYRYDFDTHTFWLLDIGM